MTKVALTAPEASGLKPKVDLHGHAQVLRSKHQVCCGKGTQLSMQHVPLWKRMSTCLL